MLTGGLSGDVRAWRVTPELAPRRTPEVAAAGVVTMALSRDGSQLAYAATDGKRLSIAPFDGTACHVTGAPQHIPYAFGGTGSATMQTSATQDQPGSLAFSPDGKRLLAGSRSGATINVYRAEAAGFVHVLASEAHRGSVDVVGFLSDDRILSAREDDLRTATLSGDKLTWGERLRPLDGAGGWTTVITSSPGGALVFIGGGRGDSGTAWLYRTRDLR